MTLCEALALARRHGLGAEFQHAYRWYRRWPVRWFVSERRAVEWALGEWDL